MSAPRGSRITATGRLSEDGLRDWMQQGTVWDFLLLVEIAAEVLRQRSCEHDLVVSAFVEAIDRGWAKGKRENRAGEAG